jgi:hypothetical protein
VCTSIGCAAEAAPEDQVQMASAPITYVVTEVDLHPIQNRESQPAGRS